VPDYVKVRRKDPRDPLKARAAAAGLKMIEHDVIPSTQRAHEAAEFARGRGQLEPLQAALLRRYWTEGQDLYSFETLRAAAVEAHLDPDELQRALEQGTYRQQVDDLIREAAEFGVRAVPTFLFEERFAIQGAQEYPVFKMAMDRLGARPRSG
jgi:predicted DsbA family dithiol-disulfide isomerase